MTLNERWNEFLKNGSVLAYLSYVSQKRTQTGGEVKNADAGQRLDNKGNQFRGK